MSSDSSTIVNPETYISTVTAELRLHGKSVTSARMNIAKALAAASEPLTHGDLARAASANKNSVTNTLAEFSELGLVVNTRDGWVPWINPVSTASIVHFGSKVSVMELPATIAQMIRNHVNDPSAVIRVEVIGAKRDG